MSRTSPPSVRRILVLWGVLVAVAIVLNLFLEGDWWGYGLGVVLVILTSEAKRYRRRRNAHPFVDPHRFIDQGSWIRPAAETLSSAAFRRADVSGKP